MAVTPTSDPRRGLGALGERLAADHLIRAGYVLVECNWRSRHGELDIVATGGRALVFCEVKTRVAGGTSGPATPLESIGAGKRRRVRRLAREWLFEHSGELPSTEELRFDAVGVTVNRAGGLLALEHVEAAF